LPRRAGLIAAATVAVSPVLTWFSQDARAYALVFLLTAPSFLFFARARRGSARRDLSWWAVFSALAIATHYFAGFVVVAEGVLLIVEAHRRRVVVAVALLTPIALRQSTNAHAGWISRQPLEQRLERAGTKLLGGDNGEEHGTRQPGPIPLGVPLALAVAAIALRPIAQRRCSRQSRFGWSSSRAASRYRRALGPPSAIRRAGDAGHLERLRQWRA
jgi:hypothetical protein